MDSVEALLSQNGAPSGFIFFKENVATAVYANTDTDVFSGSDDEGLWITVDADTTFSAVDKTSEDIVFSFEVKAGGWFPLGIRSNHKLQANSSIAANVNILVGEDA